MIFHFYVLVLDCSFKKKKKFNFVFTSNVSVLFLSKITLLPSFFFFFWLKKSITEYCEKFEISTTSKSIYKDDGNNGIRLMFFFCQQKRKKKKKRG